MTHKIISINRLRIIAVTFLQGTFHFDIFVKLSPFAVKSIFWLSSELIRLQEITYPDLVVARTAWDNLLRFVVYYWPGRFNKCVINYDSSTTGPRKVAKTIFFAAHAIGNRQHSDDVQNERSLGTNLSWLNENENGWKRGLPYLKMTFLKKTK